MVQHILSIIVALCIIVVFGSMVVTYTVEAYNQIKTWIKTGEMKEILHELWEGN